MAFRLILSTITGQLEEALLELQRPMAEAATLALREAATSAKAQGRAEIAGAGFSKKWQNAFRVDAFPRRGKVSIDAAAYMFHKIPYAEVFQTGATIRGKPVLWAPLERTPKRIARKRITPELYQAQIGPLVYLGGRGGRPLLAARAALSRAASRRAEPKITLAALRRGAAGGTPTTVLRTVPLFVGLRSAKIPKKFDVLAVMARAADRLAELYLKNLKGDA